MSFSREDDSKSRSKSKSDPDPTAAKGLVEIQDLPGDFEFRLNEPDPVTMLPADELFSDGKLVPLHFNSVKAHRHPVKALTGIRSPENAVKSCRRMEMEISSTDAYLFSPKAPRCASRWREILGLKKISQNSNTKSESQSKTTTNNISSSKSFKHFLHRSSKSSSSSSSFSDGSLNLPLLNQSDSEAVSISSSRLSLSSSSSGHEPEDLPRHSLDSEKPSLNPSPNPFAPSRSLNQIPPRMRLVRSRAASDTAVTTRMDRNPLRRTESDGVTTRGVSVDSPRLNPSGKIVFQSLERSSSSPSSFNGGPRYKHRGMERSYSANVRVTPVLNVPVCSLRGSSKSGSVFGFFSSSPQKNGAIGSRGQPTSGGSGSNRDRKSVV